MAWALLALAIGLVITVIGGLLVSTLLTLVVIPVVYDRMDRRSDAYYLERGRRMRAAHGHADGAGDEPALESA